MATELNASTAHGGSQFRRFGPFKSTGGNLYALGRRATTGTDSHLIVCFKSSDGTSWSEQDSSNNPTLNQSTNFGGTMQYMDAEQVGDIIHVYASGAASGATGDMVCLYAAFDMSADTWSQVSGTNTEYVISEVDGNDGDSEDAPRGQINIRSDSDVLVAYNGQNTASKGTDYSRVYYARRVGTSLNSLSEFGEQTTTTSITLDNTCYGWNGTGTISVGSNTETVGATGSSANWWWKWGTNTLTNNTGTTGTNTVSIAANQYYTSGGWTVDVAVGEGTNANEVLRGMASAIQNNAEQLGSSDTTTSITLTKPVLEWTGGNITVGGNSETVGLSGSGANWFWAEGSTTLTNNSGTTGTNSFTIPANSYSVYGGELSFIAYSQGGTDYYKELTSGNILDSSPTSSSLAASETSNHWYPVRTDTAGEVLLASGRDNFSTIEVGEYTTTAENVYTPSTTRITEGNVAFAWDSTNSVARVIIAEQTTYDRVLGSYDPSANSYTEVAELAATADHASVSYSLLVDGTTIRYLYTDSAADIWYEEYSLSTGASGSGGLVNVAQALAGAGDVAVEGSGALTNVGQSISGSADVAVSGSGSLANVAQAIAGTAQALQLVSGSGALVNEPQAISGAGDVAVSGSGALANEPQVLAGAGDVPVSGSGALSNIAQAIAGSGSVAVSGSGALSNEPQVIAGAGDVAISGSGALANEPQAIAGAGDVAVAGSGALTNVGQAIAGSGDVAVSGSGSLSNEPQAINGTGFSKPAKEISGADCHARIYYRGPKVFKYGSAYYALGYETGANQRTFFKATDPYGTWTELDSAGRPQAYANIVHNGMTTYIDRSNANLVHCVYSYSQSSQSSAARYCRANMSSEAWDGVSGSAEERALDATSTAAEIAGSQNNSIAQRSDDDLIIMNGTVSENISGTYYDRVEYHIKTSADSWTSDQSLDDGGQTDYNLIGMYVRGTNDDCVMVYDADGTGYYKILNSSDSLGSASTTGWTLTQPIVDGSHNIDHDSTYEGIYVQISGSLYHYWYTGSGWSNNTTTLIDSGTYPNVVLAGGKAYILSENTANNNCRLISYNGSTFTNESSQLYPDTINGGHFSASLNGSVLHIALTDNQDIWYWDYDLGFVSGSGSLTNVAQSLSGAGAVAVDGSGGLVNVAQALSGAGDVPVAGTGGLINEPQSLSGAGVVPVTATTTLTNIGQAISGAGIVPVTGSGSLANIAQAINGVAATANTATGSLSNEPQVLAGSAKAIAGATGGLINVAQAISGTGDVPVSATGSLINAGQAISGAGTIPVTGSGSLTNVGQAINGTASQGFSASGGLVNLGQAISGSADVAVSGSGSLSNEPQALAGSGVVPVVGSGSLTTLGASLAGSASVPVSGSGSLANEPQVLAGVGEVAGVDGSGGIVNEPQALSGAGTVAVSAAGALVNEPQNIVGSGTVVVTLSGSLVNLGQAISGAGAQAVSGSGALINEPQSLAGVGVVAVSAAGALVNVAQALNGSGTVQQLNIASWNGLPVTDLASWNGVLSSNLEKINQ